MIMSHRVTPRLSRALETASCEADLFGHKFCGSEHVLLAILSIGSGVAFEILKGMGVSYEAVRKGVEAFYAPKENKMSELIAALEIAKAEISVLKKTTKKPKA